MLCVSSAVCDQALSSSMIPHLSHALLSHPQGLGLFAATYIERNIFVIEYIGEMIRNEVAEVRERQYKEQNCGNYVFRPNPDWIIDATMRAGVGGRALREPLVRPQLCGRDGGAGEGPV